eukprot:1351032-Rhodomonas_salina.1
MRKGIRGLGGGKQGRECNGRLHLQGARYASLRSVRAVPAAEVSVRTGGCAGRAATTPPAPPRQINCVRGTLCTARGAACL